MKELHVEVDEERTAASVMRGMIRNWTAAGGNVNVGDEPFVALMFVTQQPGTHILALVKEEDIIDDSWWMVRFPCLIMVNTNERGEESIAVKDYVQVKSPQMLVDPKMAIGITPASDVWLERYLAYLNRTCGGNYAQP